MQRLRHQRRPWFEMRVSGLAHASAQVCWQVLTGYDRLQDFVPGLLSSTLLSRNGPQVVLEHHGVAGFLFLQQAIHLVVRVTEQPFSTLDISLVAGDMQHYASHWELQPVAPPASAILAVWYRISSCRRCSAAPSCVPK